MLTFIFKYIWIAMLIIGWIIWSFHSIRDIIRTKHAWKKQFDLDDLNESTMYWITMTLIVMFVGSLFYWIFGGAE